MATELVSPESAKLDSIAFDLPATDSPSPTKVPRRVRQRLLENKTPLSIEDIKAKLKEADLRRQQFYDQVSIKARRNLRSSAWASNGEDLRKRLEAKLQSAGQKRLGILGKARLRLTKLDELRRSARVAAQIRFEKEKEMLGMKVESRAKQAEQNRMHILKALKQRRATAREKITKVQLQKKLQESLYKEGVCSSILQKRAAAEKKRLGLLEAEKIRAQKRVKEARRVAISLFCRREVKRREILSRLESKLERAKRRRADYLRLRTSSCNSSQFNWNKMQERGDLLARKLTRCWRQFVTLRRTTLDLATAYEALGISKQSVISMPFEEFASHIESPLVIQTAKALLRRLELRWTLVQHSSSCSSNIDQLLKRLAFPNGQGRPTKSRKNGDLRKLSNKDPKSPSSKRLLRYPVRVVLCAFMIVGHPDPVFSGQGEHERALSKSAALFIENFESLIKLILYHNTSSTTGGSSEQSLPTMTCSNQPEGTYASESKRTFRSQLLSFDAAWCSYLHHFVEWKVEDSRLLVQDLARAASQAEFSMMQDSGGKKKPNWNPVEQFNDSLGVERLKSDSSGVVAKETHENVDEPSSFPASSSKSIGDSPNGPIIVALDNKSLTGSSSRFQLDSLFTPDSSHPEVGLTISDGLKGQWGSLTDEKLVTENELIVHEIVHEVRRSFLDSFEASKDHYAIKAQIKETIEKAFWDGIAEAMKQDEPDYGRILRLVKEVRDGLCELAPKSWKQEIIDIVDPDILHQVFKSETPDMNYLGRVLKYALSTLQKLSSLADEEEIGRAHDNLLDELANVARADEKSERSFVMVIIKGLRFVLEQIQILRQEISKARIRLMEPIIRGPAGFEYLEKVFAHHYGDPSDSVSSLPKTKKWLASLRQTAEQEWNEHFESLSAPACDRAVTQEFSHPVVLRTGGALPMASNRHMPISIPETPSTVGDQQPECKGDTIDVLVRVGLLKFVNRVEGLTQGNLPETLQLNLWRLRRVQSQLQKIIVLITSMLILRQILLSESLDAEQMDMETVVADSAKKLSELLDHDTDAGIAKIVDTICEPSDGLESASSMKRVLARKEMMANLLTKSLKDGDPVFNRVAHAVYLAMRGVVLGGSGANGRKLVETALRGVGATPLVDKVVEPAEVLVVVATVSCRVHGRWYAALLQNCE